MAGGDAEKADRQEAEDDLKRTLLGITTMADGANPSLPTLRRKVNEAARKWDYLRCCSKAYTTKMKWDKDDMLYVTEKNLMDGA